MINAMTNILKKRKICFVITSFIHYSRNMFVLEELNKRPDVDLHIVIGGTALISKYSSKFATIKQILINDKFKNIHEIHFNLEGDLPIIKGKTTGLGIIEFSTLFNNLKPDLVVIRGDRFEVLSATVAAAYSNIPIAHIEGGDVSGTIDESVRHAITKFSHIHFPTNNESMERIIRMGENPQHVFNFGSPEVEVASSVAKKEYKIDINKTGSGADISLTEDYIIVMYHPVVTELEDNVINIKNLIKAIHSLDMQVLLSWPNADVGSEEIAHQLRIFNDKTKNHKIRFLRDIPPKEFLTLLKNSRCLVGNSSAGIKECSYFGVPAVNIGSRQNGRLHSENVVNVTHSEVSIKKGIHTQLTKKHYPSSDLYKASNTSKKIAEVMAKIDLYVQKKFVD
jgi:UDP-hydrolysing UDP-N-acetyl-D-glucosamine 2-epimerase